MCVPSLRRSKQQARLHPESMESTLTFGVWMQYACMFISAGEPGNVKKIQASVAAARKVFRIMRVSYTLLSTLLP